ncbi:hypothetical protein RISK_004218 [Rhodopirellula islandica]|uniref:Uncharacterized protein n=1 Tax=Rhodopirellula islandica TaxID=595434 RepID=A0A0J1BBA0_RHOIS|nr:hypothetical protein RISK_004218 [Rhodopirellula islandica]
MNRDRFANHSIPTKRIGLTTGTDLGILPATLRGAFDPRLGS